MLQTHNFFFFFNCCLFKMFIRKNLVYSFPIVYVNISPIPGFSQTFRISKMPPRRGARGSSRKGREPQPPPNPENQEIDVQAAINEMLAETQTKISEALQERQTNLLTMMAQLDTFSGSPKKTGRK